MKTAPNSADVDLLDYQALENAINMVASGTMQRADMVFGPLQVKVYKAGTVIRIDLDVKEL